MKKIIIYTMFTTGAAVVILSAFFLYNGIDRMPVSVIIQILAANIVINIGHSLINKVIEIRLIILEYLINICYTTIILLISGFIFNWYSVIPIWLLPVMALIIYIFVITTSISKANKDTKEINDLLQKRREKNIDNVS